VFEPPGIAHTLTVPAHCAEIITSFNISGAMI
jgi:2,4'-dihydroxyacetophenone dioxygenase